MSLYHELKRRNVFRVGAAYIVAAWLLIQVAETIFPLFEYGDTPARSVVIVLAIGFPLFLLFSWVFELTPEGLKKEKNIDHAVTITRKTGKQLDRIIIVLLALALGYFAFDKFVLDPARDADLVEKTAQQARSDALVESYGGKSIAVLPFVDMSAAGDNEYFSDGLTEELINILAKIKELHVVGRTSSFAFKGKDADLRSIGEKLNVKSILEGSVRKDEQRNRVRITAQLINVDTGFHLWSETYDHEMDDIFATQEEIARKVAQALRVTLLGEDENRLEHLASTQMNAYDLYLQGLKSKNENSFDSLKRATQEFQQAVVLDPLYTPAQLGLVSAWQSQASLGAITGKQATDHSLPLLTLILQREPGNSDALSLMAKVYAQQRDFAAAEQSHQAALKANPRNATTLIAAGFFLLRLERFSEGMELLQRAAVIEPYSTDVHWQLCFIRAFLVNQFDASLAACERIREIDPEKPNGYYGPALTYAQSGDLARSVYWYSKATSFDQNDYELTAELAKFWADLGDLEMAQQWMQRSLALGAGQPAPIAHKIFLLLQQEQAAHATELARQAIDLQDRQSRYIIRNVYVIDALSRQEFQTALDAYRIDNSEIFEEPMRLRQDMTSRQMGALLEIAFILKSADITSGKADEILDFVAAKLQAVKSSLLPWITEINLAALENVRGNTDTAITLLNRAFEHNMRANWRLNLQHWFVLESLHDEPEYQDLVARFEEDMERQREQAYELLEIKK